MVDGVPFFIYFIKTIGAELSRNIYHFEINCFNYDTEGVKQHNSALLLIDEDMRRLGYLPRCWVRWGPSVNSDFMWIHPDAII